MSFGIPVRNGLSVSLVSSTFLSSGRRLNPALNLDFLTGGTLDPRITFSRTSQATLVDSTGKLTYAPNNLLTNSQDFESANWSKAALGLGVAPVVTANAAVAPDGTTTADRVQFSVPGNTTNPSDFSQLVQIPAGSGTAVVGSVWMRSNTGTNQTVMLRAGDTFTSVTVTPTWQRFTASQATAASSNAFNIGIRGSVTPNVVSADVLLWGAQLEQVTYQTTPGTYNSTSPKNLLGYTQEFDNAAWTKSNAFVQTNLATYSQDFTNAAWTATNTLATANSIAAPDGTLTADKLTSNAGAGGYLITESIAVTSGVTYTGSVFLKAAEIGFAFVLLAGSGFTTAGISVNLSTGAVSTALGSPLNAQSTNVGGGWWRVSFSLAATATVNGSINVYLSNDGVWANRAAAITVGSGLYLWGAQLVQGSTAGDYQRTDAAAAAVQYVAPDGSRTADKLVETTAASSHYVLQAATATVAPYVMSVYAKAAERSFISLAFDGLQAWFNLSTGAVGTVEAGLTGAIQSIGNGWYLCSVTRSVAVAGSKSAVIYSTTGNNTTSYTGDGTSGIYIWGAQLSNSASLDPYVYNPVAAPTSAAYYGPRFDYDPVTLANKGLLIEEQRTNLLTYSEQFDNAAWNKVASTITANAIVSPDGTTNADAMLETAATSEHQVNTTNPVFATSTAYTLSAYVKSIGGRNCSLFWYTNSINTVLTATFDLTAGTIVTAATASGSAPPTNVSASITPIGSGWFRVTLTGTTTATAGAGAVRIHAASGTSNSYAGDVTKGIYIYGAQLEAGSFATSYIPTVASQVTRTADIALMQGANFLNWYNQNEGTFTVEADSANLSTAYASTVLTVFQTAANRYGFHARPATGGFSWYTYVGSVEQARFDSGAISANQFAKMAGTYKTNDTNASFNGSIGTTDTSCSVVAMQTLYLGVEINLNYLNGHIRRIGYYPTRLANAQLQSLTAQSTIPSLSLDFTTQVFNVG